MAASPVEYTQINASFKSEPNPTTAPRGPLLEAGVYYSTNQDPGTYRDILISSSYTVGAQTYTFNHSMDIYDLLPNTKYYVKAYAKNITGTYTSSLEPVIPNPLETVQINSQIWTLKNCDVTRYSDGTPIPYEPDATKWAAAVSGAWCYPENVPGLGPIYGKLYNWYAVAGIYDTQSLATPSLRKSLAPKGYHVPSDAEWTTLTDYLGGASVAGGKMKATGTSLWKPTNIDATNSSGFTGLPGGIRDEAGTFNSPGNYGWWWSSSESGTTYAWYRYLFYYFGDAFRNYNNKTYGFSVRFVSDAVTPIGQQLWSTKNLDVSTYSDGTPIPQVQNDQTWNNLKTGAWCYYGDSYGNDKVYGKLYNWYAVAGIHIEEDATPTAAQIAARKKLAPDGYHVPSYDEFYSLTFSIGFGIAGRQLKANSSLWTTNTGTDVYGFKALPAGRQSNTSTQLGTSTYLHTSTINPANQGPWTVLLSGTSDTTSLSSINNGKGLGYSIRLLSNTTNQTPVNITGTGYNQTWSKTNLDVATYRDGTPIPQVTDPAEWANLTTGAWCYYKNDPANGPIYGKLYNWYAVAGIHDNDPNTPNKFLAPTGWHIPTDAEWTALTTALEGSSVAGGKMKATGTALWKPTNIDATNSSGFTGLPGGYRDDDNGASTFSIIGTIAIWWSSSEYYTAYAWSRLLNHNDGVAYRYGNNKTYGFSVRLVRDYA